MPAIVPLDDLKDSPFQPRRSYAKEPLAELTASIERHGVLQPPVVRPIGGKGWDAVSKGWDCDHFEIVVGHRRVRAARAAGLKEITVLVRPLDDKQVRIFQDIENAKRDGIPVTDRAASMAALRSSGFTVEQIAIETATGESQVRELLLLDKMPEKLAYAVNAGIVSPSAAAMVCRIPDKAKQAEATTTVVDKAYTKEQTANLVASTYQRELKRAPFPTKGEEAKRFSLSLTLPDVGCELCPYRSGNRSESEYKKLRADTCLNVACYARKEKAWRDRQPKPKLAETPTKPPAPTAADDPLGNAKRIAIEAAKRAFAKLKNGTDASGKILGHADRLVAYLLLDTFRDDYTLAAAMQSIAGDDPDEWIGDSSTPHVRAFSASVAVASIAVDHPVGSNLPIGKTFAGLLGVDPGKFRDLVKADVDAEKSTNTKSKPRKGAA